MSNAGFALPTTDKGELLDDRQTVEQLAFPGKFAINPDFNPADITLPYEFSWRQRVGKVITIPRTLTITQITLEGESIAVRYHSDTENDVIREQNEREAARGDIYDEEEEEAQPYMGGYEVIFPPDDSDPRWELNQVDDLDVDAMLDKFHKERLKNGGLFSEVNDDEYNPFDEREELKPLPALAMSPAEMAMVHLGMLVFNGSDEDKANMKGQLSVFSDEDFDAW